jgi:glycosyltransferase involved in cell wall biosynthesis
MTPSLSIILPTYNGAQFLAEQIESLLNQSHADFELLITDDGSSDNSSLIASRYAVLDRRINIVPSRGRAGQSNQLRALANVAGGEFVAIADQDDVWEPRRNEKLLAAIDSRSMAIGRSELIDRDGKLLGSSLLDKLDRLLDPEAKLRALIEPAYSGHAMIVRRSALNPAAFTWPLIFDWLLALDALYSDGLAYVDDAVVFHRIHGGNQVNDLDLAGRSQGISPGIFREAFLSQRGSRLRFWLVLSYLGQSEVVPFADRQIFSLLASRCHSEWFSHWRSVKPFKSALAAELVGQLDRFASQDSDRGYFADYAKSLVAKSTIADGIKNLLGRTRGKRKTVAT